MATKKTPKKPTLTDDETSAAHAPSVRVFTEWTPARIRAAERSAENGDLGPAATICEWLMTDDRIMGTLEARVDALMGLEPSFESGTGRLSKRAARAIEAGEDWWEAYPESELKQLLMWGILLGAAPSRQSWVPHPDHGGRVLPIIKFWHPQTLRWSWHKREWSLRDSNSIEIPVVPGDGEWILHTPFGEQRPWAYGIWRSLSRWVLLKQLACGDWSRHSEKSSLLVATSPAGATKEQRRELAQDLANSTTESAIALAAGFKLEMIEVMANTKQIYEAQISMADLAIAIRIRGGNLTTNVQGGSLAATQTQAVTGDLAKLKSDASALATTLNQQSLTWWAEFNFGDRKAAPWPKWPVEPEEDKGARALMLNGLATALTTFDTLGYEIDDKALSEEFGLSFIKGRKEVVAVPVDPAAKPGEPVPGDDADAKPAKPKPKKAALPTMQAAGYIEGQLYADDLVDDVMAKGGKALASGLLDDLREVVASATTYDEIRAAVLDKYKAASSPDELREIIRRALFLGDLAGAAAVRQDGT